MTKEEAIEIIREDKDVNGVIWAYDKKYIDALDLAIKALEKDLDCKGCIYDLPEICPIPCLNCKRIALDHYEKKKRVVIDE